MIGKINKIGLAIHLSMFMYSIDTNESPFMTLDIKNLSKQLPMSNIRDHRLQHVVYFNGLVWEYKFWSSDSK